MKIQKFFKEYAGAFEAGDVSALVGFYAFPVSFFLENGIVVTLDEIEFRKNGESLVAKYKEIKMKRVSFEITSTLELNAATSLVGIRWTLLDQGASKIVDFNTRYIIAETPEEIKILGVFTIDEAEKMGSLTG